MKVVSSPVGPWLGTITAGLSASSRSRLDEPLAKRRIGAAERRLGLHGDIAGKQDAVGLDPDGDVAAGVVGTHRGEAHFHAAEVEVVVALESDVRLAIFRALEQLAVDRGTRREILRG